MRRDPGLQDPAVVNGKKQRDSQGRWKPAGKIVVLPGRYTFATDPDREFIEAATPHLVKTIDLDDDATEVWARLYEHNYSTGQSQTKIYPSKRAYSGRIEQVQESIRSMRESHKKWLASPEAKRLKENGALVEQEPDDLFSLGFNSQPPSPGSAMGGWVNNEFLPMLIGPFSRQLYLFDYLDMHRKAFEAVNHNPIARQIVNITSSFVIGKGVTAEFDDDQMQEVWDQFVEDNDFYHKLRRWSDELSIYGELMIRFAWEQRLKKSRVVSIDPATVWEIVTEPADIEKVYFYHQQYPTPYNQIVTAPGVPMQRYIIDQIPGGQVVHQKINVTSGEKRGRSDLFSILGWLKRVKDYYTAEIVRAQGAASFLWDDTVLGSDSDVLTYAASVKANPPQPGQVFVHNQSVTRQWMGPTGRGGPNLANVSEGLMNLVGVGAGVPKEYLGITVQGARATALVATEPAAKRFEDRQYTFEHLLTMLKNKLGQSAGIPKSRREGEFTFPSIATEDRSSKLKDIALGESMAWWSKRTAGVIAAKEMNITTYDYDNEADEIAKELPEGIEPGSVIAQAFAMVVKGAAPQKGGGFGGGAGGEGMNGEGQAGMGPDGKPVAAIGSRMTTPTKAEQNPLGATGAANLATALRRKESVDTQAATRLARRATDMIARASRTTRS